MTEKNQARLVVLTALGMLIGLVGTDIKQWDNWVPLWTPATVGQLCVHVASVITSFTGGILYQRKTTAPETITTLDLRPRT